MSARFAPAAGLVALARGRRGVHLSDDTYLTGLSDPDPSVLTPREFLHISG